MMVDAVYELMVRASCTVLLAKVQEWVATLLADPSATNDDRINHNHNE